MTRVVHLSVVHRPDDPRILERECRTLARAGYDVMYMAPGAQPGWDAAGVLLAPLPQRGRRTRFLSSAGIVRSLRALRPRVLHVHDPELLTLFPIVKAFVPRLVYDMHEYVPEAVAGKPYLPQAVRPAASRTTALAQRSLAALASGVVVVTEGQLDALGSEPELRLVSPNYPRLERFKDAVPVPELAADPRLKIVYVGSLSRARGCTVMLDVMERLGPEEAVLYLGGTFNDAALEDDAWVMAVNYGGVVNGTHAFLPILLRQDSGTLVNVSSVFGLFGFPNQSSYVASKHAVRGFSESLRQELRGSGVIGSNSSSGSSSHSASSFNSSGTSNKPNSELFAINSVAA